MLAAAPWLGRFCLRWPGLVVFAVVIALSALLSTLVGPSHHAQSQEPYDWGGTVEVSTSTLTIKPGKPMTYRLRLTKPPVNLKRDGTLVCDPASVDSCDASGWWVMIRVDDVVRIDGEYKGFRWVPSVGWEFNQDNWDQWREVSIKVSETAPDDGESVTFSHEVWSNDTYCPVHGVSPVDVEFIEDGGLPSLSIEDPEVDEGDKAEFVVRLSNASNGPVEVDYQTKDGTATEGTDYTRADRTTLIFEAGQTQKTIEVQTTPDELDEANEEFSVELSNPNGAALSRGTGTGTIIDGDVPPELSIGDAPVGEGDPAQFTVTLTPASGKTVTVDYATADGTAEAPADYTSRSDPLSFSPGELSKTIMVPTIRDSIADNNETFTVTLSNPREATLDDHTAIATIIDDDLPTLSIRDVDVTVVEGGAAEFTVMLSMESTDDIMVDYATSDGTATEGTDYTEASDTLTILAGDLEKTISVQTLPDTIEESDETFSLTLSSPVRATVQSGSATGKITDDDTGGDDTGDDGNNNGNNGNTGGNNHNTNIDDGTDLNNGGEDEDELRDVGDPGLPKISIADTTVEEGDTARFVVTLSPASDQTVTVRYKTADGTADEGTDYRWVSRTLTFAPGNTRQSIAVPTRDDALDEPDETFLVTLRNPSGATLEDGSATGTIIDDDVPVPPPTLSIADATVVEGETARFAVGLSRASEQTVTVRYRTAGGTASEGTDYDGASGTLIFGPGDTEKTIAVPTREDKLDEPDETFLVALSNPSGATIQDGTATGTITDDDIRPLAPINQELLPEIGRALAFTAVRCRIEQAFSDMARGWARPAVSPSLSVVPIPSGLADGDDESLTLQDVLANTSFLLPLVGGNGGTIQFSTWGCGDYRSLAGDGGGDAGAWDGEAFSMQVGADAIVGRDLLAGVSLSQSRGSLDFDGPGGSDPAGGRYDLGLTGVHPYLGWWVSPDLEIWGTFGLAGGELQVVDDAAGSSATSAATLASATVGINGRLLTYGAATLRLKGEGSLAQLDVSKGTGLFQGASANLQRLRLAAEVEYEHVIPDVGVLVPWGELGMRHEGGDGATGSSLELGGGLHYRNIEQGWNAEVYGRWLAVQDDAPLQEQGFGLRFRYDPETPGFGPWVSLTQTWGEPASALHRLWDDGASELTAQDPVERRLGVEVGYGFPAFGGRAALMPYSAVSLEDSDVRGYRLGMRVSLGSSGLLSLETERRERPAASADHRIMLRAIARF